jgi:hypothetical protein
MTPLEVTGVAGTVVAVLAIIVRVWLAVATERKRTQPIAIAHEATPLLSLGHGEWGADAYLTNEGAGPAFNVRFGIRIRRLRWAYRYRDDDPGTGNRQRVLRPRERRPETGTWTIRVPVWLVYLVGRGDLDPVYWCRYQNASGNTWETRNSPARSSDLDIRRVRFVRLHEWLEEWGRWRAGRKAHRD